MNTKGWKRRGREYSWKIKGSRRSEEFSIRDIYNSRSKRGDILHILQETIMVATISHHLVITTISHHLSPTVITTPCPNSMPSRKSNKKELTLLANAISQLIRDFKKNPAMHLSRRRRPDRNPSTRVSLWSRGKKRIQMYQTTITTSMSDLLID